MFPAYERELFSCPCNTTSHHDLISSSTFWIVVAFLFLSILFVYDTISKVEQKAKNVNDILRSFQCLLNCTYSKIKILEEKISVFESLEKGQGSKKETKETKESETEESEESEESEETEESDLE